ncbi:MAG TPA: FGGY-family carbohydrate kinase [Hypericibacter adhaerens]|jgi:xylulokinase|uniref:xylulokinase n=1 Tax=Hypericibacter adhaerens TaxID=2602016 RepID=UPI002C2F839C|nr:FGGY-family carbohydrate kinase [Hypericibacter adhaerens]HWA41877.1 FGGY-family carbohydrate kinase [Hypericibacter adhaerens]
MTGCYLGIDLGISGARAAVLTDAGRTIGQGRSAGSGGANRQAEYEREPRDWSLQLTEACRQAVQQAGHPRIEAIGIGALGPCPVLLDRDLRPLGPAPLFSMDGRAEATRIALRDARGLNDETLGPDHVIPRLHWIREQEPERFAQAAWCVDAAGYLVSDLTGALVIDPITLCDHAAPGLPSPLPTPPVQAADAIAGGLSAGAAERLGLPAGIPVTVGTYDCFVDIAGSGVIEPGAACMLLGSTLVMGRVVEEARCGQGMRLTPHVGQGHFLGGWTSSCGSLIDWAQRLYGQDAMAAAETLPPGEGGLVMLPYVAGERTPVWDPQARGVIVGLALHNDAPQLARAALDAVALSAMDLTRRLVALSGPLASFRVNGGGARHRGLVQAIADATGVALEILAHPGEAQAPAWLAARALGRRLEPAVDRVVTPDPARHQRYAELFDVYQALYPRLASTMHSLAQQALPQHQQKHKD